MLGIMYGSLWHDSHALNTQEGLQEPNVFSHKATYNHHFEPSISFFSTRNSQDIPIKIGKRLYVFHGQLFYQKKIKINVCVSIQNSLYLHPWLATQFWLSRYNFHITRQNLQSQFSCRETYQHKPEGTILHICTQCTCRQ